MFAVKNKMLLAHLQIPDTNPMKCMFIYLHVCVCVYTNIRTYIDAQTLPLHFEEYQTDWYYRNNNIQSQCILTKSRYTVEATSTTPVSQRCHRL